MKKHLTTGLAILLPIVLTLMILNFLIDFLTHPFLVPVSALMARFDFFHRSFFLFNEMTLVTMTSKLMILTFLTSFILFIGLLGKLFLMDYLFRFGDYLVYQLPFVNKIYKACQDVVHSLFSSSSTSFSQVVLVPYPNQRNLTIGLVTGASIQIKGSDEETQDLISVFVPGTPNPSVGFLLLFKKEQLTFVTMKVEEAMKFIVSCGAVMPDFAIIQPPAAYEKQPSSESHLLPSERQFNQASINLYESSRSFSA